MERVVIVDQHDVPRLIQKIEYNYSAMAFTALFFNDKQSSFPTDLVCPSIGLMQSKPTRMQWLEAENNIRKYVNKNWKSMNS
jgi:hypothetical protein